MRESRPTVEPPSILRRPPASVAASFAPDATPRERRLIIGGEAVLGRPLAFYAWRRDSIRAVALVQLAYEANDPYLLDRPGRVTVESVIAELREAKDSIEIFETVIDELRR